MVKVCRRRCRQCHFEKNYIRGAVNTSLYPVEFVQSVCVEGATMSAKEEERTINWKLHKVLHRMKSSVSTKWFNDVRPALNLVFAASAAAATVGAANAAPTAGGHGADNHDDDNCLYCLVVKYEADRLGLNDDEGDGLKQMVHLKWIFMLDRLAEGSGPLPFPVACCTLWKDPQWLPKQWPQRQLQDLMPPWKISLAEFSLDDMLSDEVALKNHMSAVNSYLVSFINDIQGRYNSWDILPILMGWILCPVTMGWAEFP
jgi:hypothetical protein